MNSSEENWTKFLEGSGACYVEEDPPMDSLADDWMIQDGVYWRGEKLYLSICRDQTLNHTECQQ